MSDDLKERLSTLQYHVTCEGGTEQAFTGCYWNTKTPGIYHCVCCGVALFESGAKYDSGSGWPSFFEPVEASRIETVEDRSHGMIRMEVRCGDCSAHLGHVFPDGPEPTGLRYCINSASLQLAPTEAGGDS